MRNIVILYIFGRVGGLALRVKRWAVALLSLKVTSRVKSSVAKRKYSKIEIQSLSNPTI